MFKTLIATIAAVTFGVAANAATMEFDVHANNHVWNDGVGYAGNLGLDTGITIAMGEAFEVSVNNIADTWNFCSPSSSCTVNADGLRPALGTFLGTYTSAGYSNYYGALVGRVGSGEFFHIGTAGFDGTADASGELTLFHWDHNTNNSGAIRATVTYGVSAVPLPAGLPLLLTGLGAVAFATRRRKA